MSTKEELEQERKNVEVSAYLFGRDVFLVFVVLMKSHPVQKVSTSLEMTSDLLPRNFIGTQ